VKIAMMQNLPKTERNKEIYSEREKGKSWNELIRKYNISQARLVQIVKREREKGNIS